MLCLGTPPTLNDTSTSVRAAYETSFNPSFLPVTMHRQRQQDHRRTLGVLLLLNEILRGAPVPPITLAAVAAQVFTSFPF